MKDVRAVGHARHDDRLCIQSALLVRAHVGPGAPTEHQKQATKRECTDHHHLLKWSVPGASSPRHVRSPMHRRCIFMRVP
ncbi:Hypothetical protein A7982_04390 [Minicystis rosea]|nr:Hypothetical protein A7982_04390 [Minicystis rosea]